MPSSLIRRICFGLFATHWVATACCAQGALQDRLLGVTLNDRPVSEATRIFEEKGSTFYIPEDLFTEFKLAMTDSILAKAIDIDGSRYLPLSRSDGAQVHIDDMQQVLYIRTLPETHTAQHFDLARNASRMPDAVGTGMLVNYDVYVSHTERARNVSALMEASIFHAEGVFLSRHIAQKQSLYRRTFRLDTSVTKDFPAYMATLVLGDSISSPSAWSRAVYFGGVQWRTNFANRPEFQPVALPSAAGIATAPSVVDVYVDNVLRARQTVDTGPFSLDNLPVFSGQGNLQLVVRDALGRQQLISQSYLSNPLLLKRGVQDISMEAGKLRRGFGSPDARYDGYFFSGTMRHGINGRATLEGHAELEAGQGRAASVGIATTIGDRAVVSTGVAASRRHSTSDFLSYIQLDRTVHRHGFGVRLQSAGEKFGQIGMGENEFMPARRVQAQWNMALQGNAAVSMAYTSQNSRRAPDFRAISAGLTYNFAGHNTISVGLTRSFVQGAEFQATAALIMPFGRDGIGLVSASRQSTASQVIGEYQSTPHDETGWAYRLRQTAGGEASTAAGVSYQGRQGTVAVEAGHASSRHVMTAQARGSIVHLAGHTLASKWMDHSFAMVKVPTPDAVNIYANNRMVARTNRSGVAVLPNLQPYIDNPIAIDADSLSLDMSVQSEQQTVTPGWRTGHLLTFDIRAVRGATIVLIDADGNYLSPGASIRYGTRRDAEVGLRGEAFLDDASFPLQLVVSHGQSRCEASVANAPTDQLLPRIGPVLCVPVLP